MNKHPAARRHSARIASRVPAPAPGPAAAAAAAAAAKRSQLPPAASSRSKSLLHRLLDRQIDARAIRSFEKRSVQQRFSNFNERVKCDLFAPPSGSEQTPHGVEHLRERRTCVLELVVAGGLIFGLADSGICCGFDMDSGRRVVTLNASSQEVIRSLFHNKSNSTLIIVSVWAADEYSSLRCRACSLEDLASGSAGRSDKLFESESLKHPGFVEFDDVNQKVLTFCSLRARYKVWSMLDPKRVMFDLADRDIEEIKISPGIMLLVLKRGGGDLGAHQPLRILSIETGEVLRDFKQLVKRGVKIVVIEQFNQKLLLQQEGEPLLIIDLLSNETVTVPRERFQTPFAFIFLYEHQCFLSFRDSEVLLWNFRGEKVTTFADHKLWFPAAVHDHTSIIFITQTQDVIISLCNNGLLPNGIHDVKIHVSHISTGECLAKVNWHDRNNQCVTAISYNEVRGELVVGDEIGCIWIWSA